MKKTLLILAANLIPIVVFLGICELYLRTLEFEPYVRTFPGQYQNDPEEVAWAQSDPALGWVSNKANSEINPQGFRDPKDFSAVDLNPGKTRVMVLGDSFIWGAGVRREETVPGLLQAELQDHYEFFNLGVPGWGVDQMYLAYQQYRNIIRPDIVILAFIDDDVNRVLETYRIWERMNKPSFTVKNNELVLRTSAPKSQIFLKPAMAHSVFLSKIMREIYLVTEARVIVEKIFTNMASETEYRKEKFVVLRVPTRDHFDLMPRIERRLYNVEGVLYDTGGLYLDPSEEITRIPGWDEDFYLTDGHMSAAGNEYLADYIVRHICKESDQPLTIENGRGIQKDEQIKVKR